MYVFFIHFFFTIKLFQFASTCAGGGKAALLGFRPVKEVNCVVVISEKRKAVTFWR